MEQALGPCANGSIYRGRSDLSSHVRSPRKSPPNDTAEKKSTVEMKIQAVTGAAAPRQPIVTQLSLTPPAGASTIHSWFTGTYRHEDHNMIARLKTFHGLALFGAVWLIAATGPMRAV